MSRHHMYILLFSTSVLTDASPTCDEGCKRGQKTPWISGNLVFAAKELQHPLDIHAPNLESLSTQPKREVSYFLAPFFARNLIADSWYFRH